MTFHLQRIEGVYQGLMSGQFPVRIQPGWLDGNGYAASIFYGDILLYFPAMLRIIGFTVQEAYKMYAEMVNIATVGIAFYSFRKITKDDFAAMMGAVLYTGSINRLCHLYGGLVGTYSGVMFYPLVVAGFYLIFTEDVKDKTYKKLWVFLTVGFSGLLMTHMISCLMVGVFSFMACLIMIRRVFRKETLIVLCKAVLAAFFLNLWYLIPFFQYMRTEKLHINGLLASEIVSNDYSTLLAGFVKEGQNFYSLFVGPEQIGYALWLVILFYIISIPIQKKHPFSKPCRFVFLYMIVVLWVSTIYFPSIRLAERSTLLLKYFQTIQSQNRFLSVAVALAACLSALFIASNMWKRELVYLLCGALCCINLYQGLQYFATITPDVVYLDSVDLSSHIFKGFYDYGIGNGEYLPTATDTERLTKDIQTDETLQIIDYNRNYLIYDTVVTNEANVPKSILYPIIYYGGYRTFDVENGTELETVAGDNGRVQVTVPAGYSGTIHTAFCEPWYWRVAELISLLTFIFILYLYYRRKYIGINVFMKKEKKGE